MTDGKKIIWILGAGFSKSLGAPLLTELLTPESLEGVLARWAGAFEGNLARQVQHLFAGGARGIAPVARHWQHAEDFLERLDHASRAKDRDPERAVLLAFAEELSGNPWLNKAGLTKDLFREGFEKVRLTALKIMAAECCAFLANANLKAERWQPYVRWLDTLTADDTVITFNYDRVPELLGMDVPTPLTLNQGREYKAVEGGLKPKDKPTKVLKLHGSVSWYMSAEGLKCADDIQALHCPDSCRIGMATPGPSKREMIDETVFIQTNDHGRVGVRQPLKPLWDAAKDAIKEATSVVFIGYRIPPSDAFTREWLIDELRANKSLLLRAHTVLGDDIHHKDSRRLDGLLKALAPAKHLEVTPWPMFAEDFLGVVKRDRL